MNAMVTASGGTLTFTVPSDSHMHLTLAIKRGWIEAGEIIALLPPQVQRNERMCRKKVKHLVSLFHANNILVLREHVELRPVSRRQGVRPLLVRKKKRGSRVIGEIKQESYDEEDGVDGNSIESLCDKEAEEENLARSTERSVLLDPIVQYRNNMSIFPFLSQEETCQLAIAAQGGDIEARNRIVEGNLKLVHSIAKSYLYTGVPLDDLIQEGNMGLMDAVNKFDPLSEFSFQAQVYWVIKGSIWNSLGNKGSEEIHIPQDVMYLARKIRRTQTQLAQEFGRRPKMEEVVKKVGVTLEEAFETLALAQATITPLDGRDIKGSDEDFSLLDVLVDHMNPRPDTLLEARQGFAATLQILKKFIDFVRSMEISRRDRVLFLHLYGLNGISEQYILEETPDLFGVKRERIRRRIAMICKKLREQGVTMSDSCIQEEVRRIIALERCTGVEARFVRVVFSKFYGMKEVLEPRTFQDVADVFCVHRDQVERIVNLIWEKMRSEDIGMDDHWLEEMVRRIGALEKLTGMIAQFD